MQLVVIGGGPGGYTAALQAAHQGLSVTLVERDHIGGTCLNVGCIPTKSLVDTASKWQSSVNYGWVPDKVMPLRLWQESLERKRASVQKLTNGVKGLLEAAHVRIIPGAAQFDTGDTIVIAKTGERVSFDKAIIATGSKNSMANIPGAQMTGVYTSDAIMAIAQVPKTLSIVGGGVIGIEFASIFRQLGSDVNVLEYEDDILMRFDRKAVKILKRELQLQGVNVYVQTSVDRIERSIDRSSFRIVVRNQDGFVSMVDSDAVLLATGRRPNTEMLNLPAVGVDCVDGRVVVDQHCQTTVPNIYAIGDCTMNSTMLAHAAMADAETTVANILGYKKRRTSPLLIPQCVYSVPEYALVGMTEDEAIASGIAFGVAEISLSANGKAVISQSRGICRVIYARPSNSILGIHLVGLHATEVIHEATVALQMTATLQDLARTVHAHPTVAETIHEAVLLAMGRPVHVMNKH